MNLYDYLFLTLCLQTLCIGAKINEQKGRASWMAGCTRMARAGQGGLLHGWCCVRLVARGPCHPCRQ
jgi:hypothetical protein